MIPALVLIMVLGGYATGLGSEVVQEMVEETNSTLGELSEKNRTAEEVKQNTKIFHDKLRKETWIKGPSIMRSNYQSSYYLRAYYANEKIHFYQLIVFQVRPDATGPAYFREAVDLNGNKFEIIPADPPQLFQRWSFDEFVSVAIPVDYLRNAQNTGMELKLFGIYDEFLVKVEGFYIKGFLEKLKEAI